MPRAVKATPAEPKATNSKESKTRRSTPVVERKRTPVRRKAAAAPAEIALPEFDVSAHHDEIAKAAYLNWIARGGCNGSPESDWLAAVESVRAKYTAV